MGPSQTRLLTQNVWQLIRPNKVLVSIPANGCVVFASDCVYSGVATESYTIQGYCQFMRLNEEQQGPTPYLTEVGFLLD